MSADAAFSKNFESSSSSAAVRTRSSAKDANAIAVVNNIAAIDVTLIQTPSRDRYRAPRKPRGIAGNAVRARHSREMGASAARPGPPPAEQRDRLLDALPVARLLAAVLEQECCDLGIGLVGGVGLIELVPAELGLDQAPEQLRCDGAHRRRLP